MISKILSVSILMVSFVTNAAVVHFDAETTIGQAMINASCQLTVKKKPIIFGKGETINRVGQLVLYVKEADFENVRQLPVGRGLKIKREKVNSNYELAFDDVSIKSARSVNHAIQDLNFEQLATESSGNLSVKCTDDEPVNF